VPNSEKGTLGHSEDGVSDSFSADDMEARILSCYAGGHAQRRIDPSTGTEGCDWDDELADEQLRLFGWEHREQEFRDRSRDLVQQHWDEIVAVATELLKTQVLDDTEIEIIADAVAGDSDADLGLYRWLRDTARNGR
jgi:hypothetical protein